MPKSTTEAKEKRAKARMDTAPKHVFDICGWEVWIDPLNFTISKNNKEFHYSTFLNMLVGLKNKLENSSVRKCESLDESINAINASNKKLVSEFEDALEVLRHDFSPVASLGELEWL